MTQERAGFGLNSDNSDPNQIDLEELTGAANSLHQDTSKLKKALQSAGEETGFNRSEAPKKKVRKRSPYVIQKNIKMRVGMAELLAEITAALKSGSDQETLETAMLSLLEKEGLNDLKEKYERLIK